MSRHLDFVSQPALGKGLGDVYELAYDDDRIAFMQHVLNDSEQLGSAVVRVFSGSQDRGSRIEPALVATRPVSFYTHVFPVAGETSAQWRKVGSSSVESVPGLVWFTPPPKRMRDKECDEWRIWMTNEASERVDSGDPRLRLAEFGAVMAPEQVLERVRTGQWSFPCPAPIGGEPWSFVRRRAT